MPYKSLAQEGWAHTPEGEKALGGPSKVAEWDAATKGKHLPHKVAAHAQGGPIMNKGYQGQTQSFAQGGAVLGRERSFLKVPDQFTDGRLPPKDTGRADDPGQEYGKGKGKSEAKGRDKSLKPVKPHA